VTHTIPSETDYRVFKKHAQNGENHEGVFVYLDLDYTDVNRIIKLGSLSGKFDCRFVRLCSFLIRCEIP